MSNLFHDLETSENSPKEVLMVVENPSGYRGKLEYNKKYGAMILDRVSYSALPYPVEYGFIPRSWNKYDNDPMDIMALSSVSTYPGVIVNVRVLGMLKMEDTGELDHKVFGVPENDPIYNDVNSIEDISSHIIQTIEFYFANYKKLMKNKEVKILGWEGKEETYKFINETLEEYKNKFKK
jgi:inorganic pyrophosphatase